MTSNIEAWQVILTTCLITTYLIAIGIMAWGTTDLQEGKSPMWRVAIFGAGLVASVGIIASTGIAGATILNFHEWAACQQQQRWPD